MASRLGVKQNLVAAGSAVTLVAGLAFLTACADASGQPGGTARPSSQPKAPLVTEQLGATLPCNQRTQIGLDGCAEHKLLTADKLLNADIRVLWGLLGGPARNDFVVAQDAWVRYRSADCRSQSDVYRGGVERPTDGVRVLSGRRQCLTAPGPEGLLRAVDAGDVVSAEVSVRAETVVSSVRPTVPSRESQLSTDLST